jgi:hypothetical protein
MKTAIIISGNIRTWELCKTNFIDTFSELDPDIFVSTYNQQYGYHQAVQDKIGDHEDGILTDSQIIDGFDGVKLCGILIEDYDSISSVLCNEFSILDKNFKDLTNVYPQYRKMEQGIELMCDYETSEIFRYDMVIRTRFDLIYNSIDFKIPQNSILIDSGNVFPNDCFFMTDRDSAINISKFMVDECYNPIYPDSHLHSPHRLFMNSIKHYGKNIITKRIMKHVWRKGDYIDTY